jgi:geranylgeranyl diphosphate synthase type II
MVTAASDFESFAATARRRIDDALAGYCEFGNGCPSQLGEAIRYSLLAPGKRLRPLLVLLAADACGGAIERAMPAACAVEMIHAYSLIHDDLPAMDNDDLRRGRPTNHKVFGDGLAILAGDALQARAFEIMARDVRPPEVAARCCARLAEAADDLGQQFQAGDLATLESVHRRKTGAMLAVSLELGWLCAGASPHDLPALLDYGDAVGLAFQITDDLLDVRGTALALGKGVRKDSGHGKLTFPGLLGIDDSMRRAHQCTERACQAIASLGERGAKLRALANYIVERDR